MVERALALEVEDCVHDVLEHLRSGDAAALGDVADYEHGRAALFCETHETRGALADLSDIAGRALEIRGEDRLNRIDDERGWRRGGRGRENGLEVRFAKELDVAGVVAESIGAELDLQRRFLA